MWDWRTTNYECPVCGQFVWSRKTVDDGNPYVYELACRVCHEWKQSFVPNAGTVTIGFLTMHPMNQYGEFAPSAEAMRYGATEEIRVLLRHPEYETMKRTLPDYALADWLGEREPPCPVQEAALRETIRRSQPPTSGA